MKRAAICFRSSGSMSGGPPRRATEVRSCGRERASMLTVRAAHPRSLRSTGRSRRDGSP
jgi:hypothetical protein